MSNFFIDNVLSDTVFMSDKIQEIHSMLKSSTYMNNNRRVQSVKLLRDYTVPRVSLQEAVKIIDHYLESSDDWVNDAAEVASRETDLDTTIERLIEKYNYKNVLNCIAKHY